MEPDVSRPVPGRRTARSRPRTLLVALLVLVVGGPAAYGIVQWEQGNFAVVSDQLVYRSRQLTGSELTKVIEQHHIKSILNLRGENQGSSWYRDEVAVAEVQHVQLADYQLSANRELASMEVAELLALMRTLPKPMLIHCRSGADRTGLAAALYLFEVEGRPPQVASSQLSWLYGHVPTLFWAKSRAMDDTFWRVVNRGES